jgi:ATP-binding cassette subfamily B (MDR/TAP) protein 1
LATVTASVFGFGYLGFRLSCKIRQAYFTSILRQNIAFYDQTGAGEIAACMTVNINAIQDGLSEKVGLTITGLATFVTALIIAFVRSWRLALILLSVVAAIILSMGGVGKVMKRFQAQALETSSAGSTIAQEAMSSMRIISALGAQSHFEHKFTSRMAASDQFEMKWRATLGVLIALMMFIMVTQYALAFWTGYQFLERDETTISRLLTTIMAAMIAGVSFGHIAPHLGSFGAAAEASDKVFSLIDRESPIDPGSMEGRRLSHLDGTITFKDITHWYPANLEGPPVLSRFSLHIPAGKTTAVIGASGSGKSTLVALLMRFYLPARGGILVDGHDMEKLNLRWWRQQVALVSQEPVLFNATIFENIAYGLKAAEHGEVRMKPPYPVMNREPNTDILSSWAMNLDNNR